MADPTPIELLHARIRDVVSRKRLQEVEVKDLHMIGIYEKNLVDAETAIKELDAVLSDAQKIDSTEYQKHVVSRDHAEAALKRIKDDERNLRDRYDASLISIGDVDQLLSDIGRNIEDTFPRALSDAEFTIIDNYLLANLFLPVDERIGPFEVPVGDPSPTSIALTMLNETVARAMIDGELEAIKWPAAMTEDKKIGIIRKQLQIKGIITPYQRDHDPNVLNNIKNNLPRLLSDIDQYTSATASSFENGVDEVLGYAIIPTDSERKGQLAGWTQLGQPDMLSFEEYTSAYKTAGMTIEDIAKWGSAAALKELEDYIKLQFPDALITDAQKDARDRIIAEAKIALQGNIDSLGATTPIEHIAAVNQNIFNHYVYGDIDPATQTGSRVGVKDQLEQAKALEDAEQYIEDRGKAFEKFDTEAEAYSAVDKFINLWGWGAEIPDSIRDDIAKDVYDTYQRASFDPSAPIPTLNDILAPYVSNVPNWINFKRNQDVLQSETELPQAIRDMLGMGESMLKRTPEVWQALDTGARISLEELIRNAYELDPYSSKSPSDYAAEFMQSRGITPSGDIGEYPTVWSPTVGDINYPTGETFIPQRPTLTPEEMAAGYTYGDVPATDAELDTEYIRRLEEAGLPRAIIDFETRRITDEYQKAMVEEQLQSGRPPQIPEEFINFARDYQGYDFMGDIGVQATNARTKATKARAALEGITDASERVREEFQVRELETIADKFEGLVAQQVGDPTYARLTDADFPTREALLGGIRDEFSGSAAGREFIERQISEGNIDFSDIDTRLGEIRQREGLRHHQTRPTDPMALVPSFTQQQLPALTQKFAQEQQEEQIRRGELTGMGSTIFRRRTL